MPVPGAVGAQVAGAARDRLDGSADGIAAVLDGKRAAHRFEPAYAQWIHGVPVLVRAVAEGGIVQPDTVDQHQGPESGEPAQVGGSLSVGGFLDHGAGLVGKGLGKRSRRLVDPDLAAVQHADAGGDLPGNPFLACGGDHDQRGRRGGVGGGRLGGKQQGGCTPHECREGQSSDQGGLHGMGVSCYLMFFSW